MSNFTDQFGPQAGQRVAAFAAQGALKDGGTAVGSKGHGMLDWIPTLTGTLGAIGGGAAGTAVAPGVGTAVGGVGGAALGQSAGKALENLLTGDKTTAGDLAKEAAIGGGGQLAGGIIGKVGGAVAGKVAGGLGKAGDSFITKATFGGASKVAQQTNKATSTIRDLQNLGVHPNAVESAIPVVTGDTGTITNAVRTALTNTTKPVDLSEAFPLAGRAADSLDVTKTPGAGAAFRTDFNNLANQMIANGQPITKVGANTAFDMMKVLENKAFAKGVSPDIRNAYLDVANHIGDKLSAAGADAAVVKGAFQPGDIAALSSISPKLADAASSAKTVGELRALQAPFVRSNKLLQDAATQAESTGGKVTLPGGLPVNAAVAAITGGASLPAQAALAAANTKVGQTFIGKALNGASGLAGAAGKIPGAVSDTAGIVRDTLLRGGADAALNGNNSPSPAAQSIDPTQDPSLLPGESDNSLGSSTADNSNEIDFNAEARKILSSGADAKTQAAQLDLLAKYQAIAQAASKTTTPKALSNTANVGIANAQAGLTDIGQISKAIKDNPNILFENGLASSLPGVLGNVARGAAGSQQLESAINNAMDVIARARTGAAMPAQEKTFYRNLFPKAGDSPDQAQAKLERFQTELSGYLDRAQQGSPTIDLSALGG